MRTLLATALLFLGSCSAVQMPECWPVITPRGIGSSVPIAQRGPKLWLLTARHILPALMANGLKIVDAVAHPTRDLALISVIGTAKHFPPLATERAKLGDRLFAAGYQNGTLLITDGYQGQHVGRMSCPIAFGASGGPVWNERGELIGVNEAILILPSKDKKHVFTFAHVAFYASVVDLENWIADNIK